MQSYQKSTRKPTNGQTDPRDFSLYDESVSVREDGVAFGVDARIGARVRDGSMNSGIVTGLTDELVVWRDDKTGRECAERYGHVVATLRPPATLPATCDVRAGACAVRMYPGRAIRVAVDSKMTDARLTYATPDGVFAEVTEGETIGVPWRDVDMLVTAEDFKPEPAASKRMTPADLLRVGLTAHVEESPDGFWDDHAVTAVYDTHVEFEYQGETREAGWPKVRLYANEVLRALNH